MFYPLNSLRKGGRFYMCWIAESCPVRFAKLTERQLWSQDIGRLCKDLEQIIMSESGRTTQRFSLRLSSQLMRGLVRIYYKKVNLLFNDLCMIDAYVMKYTNEKWAHHEKRASKCQPPTIQEILPEHEERVEEMIQNSNNLANNIQDITMKEVAVPEFQLQPNDNFGEENPELILQLLADKTMEQVLVPGDVSAVQHSGLDVPVLDVTEKSHDKSRFVQQDIQMERISEHDVTLFRKSTGEELISKDVYEREIPRTPELPLPEESAPRTGNEQEKNVLVSSSSKDSVAKEKQIEDFQLEELEEIPSPPKKLKKNKLIIDEKIIISGNVFRQRIAKIYVELRCRDGLDDLVDPCELVPAHVYMRTAAHCDDATRSYISEKLCYLYTRNIKILKQKPLEERQTKETSMDIHQRRHMTILDRIEEVDETTIRAVEPRNVSDIQSNVPDQIKPSEMPPQNLLESRPSKRHSDIQELPPKRSRPSGMVMKKFVQSVVEAGTDKEILPAAERPKDIDTNILLMLQQEGLADIRAIEPADKIQEGEPTNVTRKSRSEDSEPLLGSLDRTKVSLGDSIKTTESVKFIRNEWGTEGTLSKIIRQIRYGKKPVNMKSIIRSGPVIEERRMIIVARCFSSILKLKQHGFIRITKDPDTLEITDILLGPKFV